MSSGQGFLIARDVSPPKSCATPAGDQNSQDVGLSNGRSLECDHEIDGVVDHGQRLAARQMVYDNGAGGAEPDQFVSRFSHDLVVWVKAQDESAALLVQSDEVCGPTARTLFIEGDPNRYASNTGEGWIGVSDGRGK